MTAEELKAMTRRTAEIWNDGNLDLIDEMYAPNCSFHDPSFEVNGVQGLRDQVTELRSAQPDVHIDIHEVLCDGDLTVSRYTMGGTATGEFRGLPATGKSYVMSGMNMAKWQDGKIVEEWINYDLLGALQQVGIIPSMQQQEQTAG